MQANKCLCNFYIRYEAKKANTVVENIVWVRWVRLIIRLLALEDVKISVDLQLAKSQCIAQIFLN